MVDKPNQNMLKVLHHNAQSLHNKLGELSLLLSLNHMNMDVLCFTEHWLSSDHINIVNIDQFKLVSSFNRNNRGGGSCIFVRKFLHTKEINYLYGIGLEKSFELSAVELVDLKIVLVCIYRSPDGDFNEFLHKLELVMNRIQGSRKRLILCGDWNINFLQQSTKLQDL
jgi:exonuclease III